ncbi:hypothetical protein NicSoilB8_18910 [Arthrobacter sp. NicSoilB8]|nr:hypothetical protein NicSoilB8_18910 [Arthrobacter sp. NicSoilB8]
MHKRPVITMNAAFTRIKPGAIGKSLFCVGRELPEQEPAERASELFSYAQVRHAAHGFNGEGAHAGEQAQRQAQGPGETLKMGDSSYFTMPGPEAVLHPYAADVDAQRHADRRVDWHLRPVMPYK